MESRNWNYGFVRLQALGYTATAVAFGACVAAVVADDGSLWVVIMCFVLGIVCAATAAAFWWRLYELRECRLGLRCPLCFRRILWQPRREDAACAAYGHARKDWV